MTRGSPLDVEGMRFGRLTAIRVVHEGDKRKWRCTCDCGNETSVIATNLMNGNTKSCGCLHKELSKFQPGCKCGSLLVIRRSKENASGNRAQWECLCDCGNEITVTARILKSQHKSCGCKNNTLPPHGAARNKINAGYRRNSKQRGHSFELSAEESEKLFAGDCFYCGRKPHRTYRLTWGRNNRESAFTYNGIDRVDNSRGYTTDNVVSCCKDCNIAKGEKTHTEFLEWVASVYNHSIKRGE